MVTIIQGDALTELAKLPAESVHCCVTSPPYWGLRDYGVAGQLGLEPTIAEYIAKMVAVFREVRRVLRPDGTAWVNMGDTYNAYNGNRGTKSEYAGPRACMEPAFPAGAGLMAPNLKPKDLCGVPWRLAFALQDDGWYLRQDIIWQKPNPMPESVTDRCTKCHEYIFLLSKSDRYYFDQTAILEPVSENTHARISQNIEAQIGSDRANGGTRSKRPMKAVVRMPAAWHEVSGSHEATSPDYNPRRKAAPRGSGTKNNASFDAAMAIMPVMRNKSSVWTVPTFSYSEAHFATFPPALIRPCILAGCPVGGLVLDPFEGSGTTGEVSEMEGRNSILIELNPAYCRLARRRTAQQGLFCASQMPADGYNSGQKGIT